ncbi:Mss4-like protein [Lactarius sanguifluus]|nr:Mss4-like protein [Lactarius sanguifluus]
MPVELKGSCHCGAVAFTVQSSTPVPYALCVCSICRKVGGTGGSVNLGAHAHTLQITKGKENISIYKAVLSGRGTPEERRASSERHFCSKCSAMLWLWDETWPELLHPFASAIDEPELKAPEEMTVIMATSAPGYVRLPEDPKKVFKEYPDETLEDWHKRHGEYVE